MSIKLFSSQNDRNWYGSILSLELKGQAEACDKIINLLVSTIWSIFLGEMVDGLCSIPAKGPLPKVLGLSGD